MKKFLSLVLALVMTMSLVTVAGAEDYTDDASIAYEEAVDVVSAVGIVGGYADGSFNPKGTLTRGAAAKIICNMILGPTTAEALAANEAPYADVPADHTFAGYIAYLANEGIVSGYADGTFKPAATLTGYAFWKMLLGALGYDAAIEGYTGTNWAIAVAKRGLKIDLDKGLDGTFVGTKALTREEACLYAFNTLNAHPASYWDKGQNITVGGVTINTGASEVSVDTSVEYYQNLFGTKLVESAAVVDALGRPSVKWTYEKEEIGTYAQTADYVVTFEKTYGDINDDTYTDMVDFIDVLVEETENDDLTTKSATKYYVNGYKRNSGASQILAADKSGTVVEIFVDDEDKINTAVILNYRLAQIEEVDTEITKADKADGVTAYIDMSNGGHYKDTEFAGYDAATYVEDAYVLYIAKSGEVLASYLPETVEGVVTATKSGEVAVDGVWYDDESGLSLDLDDEGTFYLNKAGDVVAFEGVSATSENYAYVTYIDAEAKTNDGGYATTVYTAYVVLADGTKASYVIADDDNLVYYEDQLIAYSINSDGEIEKDTAADTIAYKSGATIDKDHAFVAQAGGVKYRADGNTEFVFIDESEQKVEVKTATGYKAVEVSGNVYFVGDAETGKALRVFVLGTNGIATGDEDLLAVRLTNDEVKTKNADGDIFYTYDVAIDGEETTLTFTEAEKLASTIVAGDAFEYDVDADGYAKSASELGKAKINFVSDDYVILGGGVGQKALADETVYTIVTEYDADGAVESIYVKGNGTYTEDAYAYYDLDSDNELETVFVLKTIR